MSEQNKQEPVAWVPIEQPYMGGQTIDILMGDGSILCNVLPQFDGDLWWEGAGTGEKFIDPKRANVTHWRVHSNTAPPLAQQAAPDEWIALVKEARRVAMEQTYKAPIPECGHFGAIAQDLDYLIGLMTSPPADPVQKINTSDDRVKKTEEIMHVQPPRPWPRQSYKK
jgi:hypothetical protein